MSIVHGDLERLQGQWNIVSLQIDGRELPNATFASAKIIIRGDNFSTEGMGLPYSGSFVLDETGEPKKFDINFSDGPHAGKASLGLYTLNADQWILCMGFSGYDRPAGFFTTPGCGHALETLHRDSN
jgi:uncharacterized protein (TIGR03067 family)